MAKDVEAKYPTLFAVLTRASERRVKSGWLAIITLILEFLGPLLENCFEDEDSFAEQVTDPNWFQVRRLERAVFRGLRRDKVGKARFRRGKARQIVDDIAAEVSEAKRSELAKCFSEVN